MTTTSSMNSSTSLTPEQIERAKNVFLNLQSNLTEQLLSFESADNFLSQKWQKEPHEKLQGDGITNVFQNGECLDKGGVNFSHVKGAAMPASASSERQNLSNKPFQALGTSIVIHPRNPLAPTSHCNIRLFVVHLNDNENVWWFGGGYDLTPFFANDEDVVEWHQAIKDFCDKYDKNCYNDFKKRCDDYFLLKHRNETRGVGGLFFDDLNATNGWDFEKAISFVEDVGKTYVDSYISIIRKRHKMPFTEQQVNFQQYRRGRYVEFNLLYDRGTIFGLQSGGRVESILMSLPNQVQWHYEHQSPEQQQLDYYLQPRDWLGLES